MIDIKKRLRINKSNFLELLELIIWKKNIIKTESSEIAKRVFTLSITTVPSLPVGGKTLR